MRFHWMNRGDINSVEEIELLSKSLESYGYYSVLLTYHSKSPDLLIKSFRAAQKKQKIKYMLAIRTYAISPEYMTMICRSYNEEFPEKLILNVVSGDIHKDETSIDDLVWISNCLDSPEKRLPYTKEWLKKFNNLASDCMPEIFMGGHSNFTRRVANDFDATHISMLDMYREYLKNPDRIVNKKQMVSLSILIRDSVEEAKDFIKENAVGNGLGWTLYGNRQDVLDQIKILEQSGVTDIIIAKINNDDKEDLIHELVGSLI